MKTAPLRNVLKTNAGFSLMSGLAMTFMAEQVAGWLGIAPHIAVPIVGIGLILFAASVYFTATRDPLPAGQVKFIIIQDWLWVAGSALVILLNPFGFSSAGLWITGIVALIVMMFAIGQKNWLKASS
ncbi:MAG: hypothetical protein ACRBF0_24600 [Calditrichia bacterium]